MKFDCESCIKKGVCRFKHNGPLIKKDILKTPWGDGYTYNERNNEPFEIFIECKEFLRKNNTYR